MSALLFNKPGLGNRVQYVSSAEATAAGYPQTSPCVYTTLPTAPKAMGNPTISGAGDATTVGTVFTVSDGAVSAWPAPTITYQWMVDGSPAGGETADTFDTTGLNPGDEITCTQTATNASGAVSMTSNAVVLS